MESLKRTLAVIKSFRLDTCLVDGGEAVHQESVDFGCAFLRDFEVKRHRELGTDREVSQYIFRETILLTVLGIIFGLVLGRFLATYVIETAEIDLVMFGRDIKWQSYVYATALTMIFSLLNSLIMRRPIRKISMVESLKSVE